VARGDFFIFLDDEITVRITAQGDLVLCFIKIEFIPWIRTAANSNDRDDPPGGADFLFYSGLGHRSRFTGHAGLFPYGFHLGRGGRPVTITPGRSLLSTVFTIYHAGKNGLPAALTGIFLLSCEKYHDDYQEDDDCRSCNDDVQQILLHVDAQDHRAFR